MVTPFPPFATGLVWLERTLELVDMMKKRNSLITGAVGSTVQTNGQTSIRVLRSWSPFEVRAVMVTKNYDDLVANENIILLRTRDEPWR